MQSELPQNSFAFKKNSFFDYEGGDQYVLQPAQS